MGFDLQWTIFQIKPSTVPYEIKNSLNSTHPGNVYDLDRWIIYDLYDFVQWHGKI